ncbi:DUF2536 family protein [Polyangium jinanense]|uniref:TerB family tellurite resistance protein n=1 Tax=Polyangium jinanense TaxID=2829994 RepID=UPI00233FF075|nr:TerB family tellurite resistance protein [Polyangium jinanense]MDC3962949.1 DUF2536 family protein [Polyangium jinanense]
MGFSIKKRFTESAPEDHTNATSAAILELALWGALADGELSDDDVNDLLFATQQIPSFEHFTADDLDALIERISEECPDQDAIVGRVQSIVHSIRDPRVQRLTYQILVFFAAKDGELSEAEESILSLAQESWGISDDEAQELTDAAVGA